MTTNGGTLHVLASNLRSRTKTLLNNELKKTCREEGYPVSGNKATLLARVAQILDTLHSKNDEAGLQRMRYRIGHRGEAPPPGYVDDKAAQDAKILYKDSPFYHIQQALGPPVELESSTDRKTTKCFTIDLSKSQAERIMNDCSLRIYLFSAVADQPLSNHTRADVAFPAQNSIEIRVNGGDVKANYRGLKGKPGTTRPVDITDQFFRFSAASMKHTFSITYALTSQKYKVHVCVVKRKFVEELVEQIVKGSVITKQRVIDDMKQEANDPDVVLGPTTMSLKDPVMMVRIKTPCRSSVCNHNQCFDAHSFLQLQEQTPTWQCPICNAVVAFECLAVDQFVQEILATIPADVDQVTIQPGGRWSLDNQHTAHSASPAASEDGDMVEIGPSRASTGSKAMTPRTGEKRSADVIDLTLDDDEDEELPRPPKKVAYKPSATPPVAPSSTIFPVCLRRSGSDLKWRRRAYNGSASNVHPRVSAPPPR